MKSLRYLYRIGHGPSSSHTMGPANAILTLKEYYKEATHFDVTLYGSLSFTGRGHLTDYIIKEKAKPLTCDIHFNYDLDVSFPNTFKVDIYQNDKLIDTKTILSLGGGAISINGISTNEEKEIYPHNSLKEIKEYCKEKNWRYFDYVYHFEGEQIKEYLLDVWKTMENSISNGLSKDGYLPGKLKVLRKAKTLFESTNSSNENNQNNRYRLLAAYSYAVSEENASGGVIVTAPTCGACGVVPSVLKFYQDYFKYDTNVILNALATASIFGNLAKTNGSISGAEAGCQAEIGNATAMAAALIAEIKGLSLDEIECAAEIAIEHSLGLTCDPIEGYVQIPCIERNAVFAVKALGVANLADVICGTQHITFDEAVKTAYLTGKDMRMEYKETSKGGLATSYKNNANNNYEKE
jgi:L-serine dehydratase